MNVWAALVAGVVGSGALVAIERALPHVSRMEIDLLRALAGRLTRRRRVRRLVTWGIPFVVGALFGLVYAGLWSAGIGRPTWPWALAFGTAHGVATILVAPYFRHRLDPTLGEPPSRWVWMAGEVIDHIVYVLAVAWTYGWLMG